MRPASPPILRAVSLAAGLVVAGWTAGDTVAQTAGRVRKPTMDDTIRVNVYADNWFMLYVNGELVAVDSIAFIPHNVISVDLLPTYPMTIAVMAKDNADPSTGMEYANTSVGDGGFILKFGDGTVTDAGWKAKCFSRGPVGGDTTHPSVETSPIPAGWYAVDFDDSDWGQARVYGERDIDPKQPYYDADFAGASFIWTDDLVLDNTVIFRRTVARPPDGRPRADFSKLNDSVPAGGPKPGGRRPPGGGRPR